MMRKYNILASLSIPQSVSRVLRRSSWITETTDTAGIVIELAYILISSTRAVGGRWPARRVAGIFNLRVK